MTINKKLYHLGNDVVSLSRRIEEKFPESMGDPLRENFLKEIFIELLRIVNIIRQETYMKEEPARPCDIRVICNPTQLKEIEEELADMKVKFDILDMGTGEFISQM